MQSLFLAAIFQPAVSGLSHEHVGEGRDGTNVDQYDTCKPISVYPPNKAKKNYFFFGI